MKSDEGRTERSAALALETVVEPSADDATLSSQEETAPPGAWTGDRAGRYWLRSELGVGGMGRVYEGYDPELQRPVAVKLLHSSFDAEWLSREARALAKLSHPNVVAVYDVGTFRARVFVAMELVDGTTLRQWVAEQPRKLEELLAIAIQAGRGLAAAHDAGLLHRDFKPDNVMVGRDGRVRVLDFGIVKAFKQPTTSSVVKLAPEQAATPSTLAAAVDRGNSGIDTLAGTPAYMAPEQLSGELMTPATDQFSFCVSLWELLYGQRPFAPEKLLALGMGLGRNAVVPDVPVETGWVPNWLRRVVEKGLAIEPAERHASMVTLLDALESGLARAAEERRFLGRRYEILSAASGTNLPGAERALDRFTGRLVTIKRLVSAPSGTASATIDQHGDAFRQCASLRHPGLIGVLDFGLDSGGQAYWVLDLKDEGQSLLAAMRRSGARPALEYLGELLQVLGYLHKHGVLLRDLDPAMIVVVGDQVKIAPIRLPPSAQAARSRQAREPQQGVASLDLEPQTAKVLERLLATEAGERFQTAEELAQALEAATGQPRGKALDSHESLLRAAPFLGRDEELSMFGEAVRAACDGEGAAWLVSGDSGVGKSRLLDEIASLSVVEGALVLRGHDEREGGSPYQLFRDVLRSLALLSELDEAEASVLAPVVPSLEKLLGRPIASAPELDALSTHGRLVEIVKKVLLRQPQPIVMLLEDVQWARSDSLDLLQHLAKTALDSSVLIVATARDDAPPSFREQVSGLSPMQLGRLPRSALAQLAEAMIGKNAQRTTLLDLLERETEGNAFFLVEVVRALAEEAGGLERIGSGALPDKVFAGGVQSVVKQRLRAVSGQARALLSVAAVSGRRLEPRLLARLMPQADLNACIATCIDAAILEQSDDELRFRHDKLREGVLATLAEDERVELHARVAEALEAEHQGEPEFYAAMALHFGQASNPAKEAHYAGLAGDYALLHGAIREALELLERSRAWLAKGQDPLALARVCVTLGDAYYLMTDMRKSMACASQAGAALGVRFPSSAAGRGVTLFWHLVLHVAYRVWPTLAARTQAHERARYQVASVAAGCVATAAISQSDALGVLLFSLMAWNLGERASAPNLWASGVLGYGLATLGLTGLAKSYFVSTERGARVLDGSYAVIRTGYLIGTGDLDAAEALMREGLELAPRTGFYRAEAFRWFYLGYCAYFRGDLEEADKRFVLAAAHDGTRANFAPGLALVRCLDGKLADAESHLREALHEDNPAAPRAIALGVLAMIQARRDELPAALRTADSAVALAGGGNTFGYAGAAYFAGVFEAYLAELTQAKRAGRATGAVLHSWKRAMRHCEAWAKAFPIGRPLLLYYTAKHAQWQGDASRAQQLWRESQQHANNMNSGLYATLAARALEAGSAEGEPRRADASSAT
ncbi:MAG TPA: protein kinase [Polyangiaceae bacterium]|nr:protein kinase [Polyangiaceae bacterium]